MNWIERLTQDITRSQALIMAISGAITTVIAAYQAVMIAWKNRNMDKLRQVVIRLIARNEKNPLELYSTLEKKPDVNPVENDGKTIIVIYALYETEMKLLKRCKMTDMATLYHFIHETYQQVKPVIKAYR